MKDKLWIFLAVVAASVFLMLFYIISLQNETDYCQSFQPDKCPENCVVCPPCEVCSSVRCNSERFCESIGFNRSWSEGIARGIPPKD